MKRSIVYKSDLGNQLLLLQEFSVIKPYSWHLLHVTLQSTFMGFIHNVVEILLRYYRKLFAVLSCFLKVIIPELVASWQVLQGSIIQRRSDFEAVLGHSEDCIPPRSKVIDVDYASHERLSVNLIWRFEERVSK